MRFTETDIEILLNNPGEVSDRPYLLFTSYALNAVRNLVITDDDDEDQEMWGETVDKDVFDKFLSELVEDFMSSSAVTIQSHRYTIRRASSIERERLSHVFSFRVRNGCYVIEKDGIVNINEGDDRSYSDAKAEMLANKEYLRKVIMVAEDDEHDGWSKLTDMEVAMYCWALYWNKNKINDIEGFQKKYRSWHSLTDGELRKGWSEQFKERGIPGGMYTFSAEKVRKWNELHDQESVIDRVDKNAADDYWFEKASMTTFK